jgi:hypothetical protein
MLLELTEEGTGQNILLIPAGSFVIQLPNRYAKYRDIIGPTIQCGFNDCFIIR